MAELFWIPLLALMMGAGCAGLPCSQSQMVHPMQSRCDAALARLGVTPVDRIVLMVMENPSPGAYAYPSGRLYVTRGLVELASDDELAAALAHELGHLYDRGHLKPPFALTGGGMKHRDVEARADAAAVKLLTCQRISSHALVSLLEKVRSHPKTSKEVGQHLTRRLELLAEDQKH